MIAIVHAHQQNLNNFDQLMKCLVTYELKRVIFGKFCRNNNYARDILAGSADRLCSFVQDG